MNEVKRISVLKLFEKGRYLDEQWLVHHVDCSIAELNEMVADGLLFKIEKVAGDFMSNNKYMITPEGWKRAHKR